jgi:membrane-bound lytic murein transglycosylase D
LYRVLCAVITAVLVIGCSEKPVQRTVQSPTSLQNSSQQTPILFASSSSFFLSDNQPRDTVSRLAPADTLRDDEVAFDSNGVDDEKDITELLETARKHYLSALQAQAEGDSATSAFEFEEAIKHLNEASYYPDIETNADFNELTKSVIEDYEKYIATIDSLGPQSSIFALREKLNLDIEKIDITNLQIPPSLIPKTEVPLHINEYSLRAIAFFLGKGRSHMENWIYRSGKYFPLMSRIFAEEGLPQELMYLSMPESGLNPVARSWAKAVGLWQFMSYTGALYGLRSNYWYDERRDFEKATRAAAKHMKDLYNDFNDWHLVFVAYNAGPGWVKKAIRRTGSTDFWEMRHRLPRETRNYVPQYIAVTLIAMRPEAFGFSGIQKADSLSFEYVTVDDCVALDLLAECADTDVETLRELNPELIQWCTPPNYKGYRLRIPIGKSELFAERYAQIPDDKKFDFATHSVRRGETISTIAKKYGVGTSILFDVNKISRKTKLKVGSTLVIPIQSKSVAAVVEAQRKKEIEDRERAKIIREQQKVLATSSSSKKSASRTDYEPAGRKKLLYTVKKGETLGHIAEWFHVRASHIRNWNNIPYGKFIYVGQTLKIWVPEERYQSYKNIASLPFQEKQRTIKSPSSLRHDRDEERHSSNWIQHRIKKGETLETIAQMYDVAIADIKSWNKLRTSRIIAGTTLEIYSPGRADDESENGSAQKNQPAASSKNSTAGSHITHIVKKGDTLEKIAERYNVTIPEVKKWNHLSGSRIYVGQKLIIQQNDEST